MKVNSNYLRLMRLSSPLWAIPKEISWKTKNRYYRSPFMRSIKKTEWSDKEGLKRIQLAKLKRIVKHAYETIPFYKNLLDRCGVSPGAIKDLADIRKLPVIRKDDLRKPGVKDSLVSGAVRPKDTLFVSSSGSTGSPFVSIHSKNSIQKMLSYVVSRRLGWAGVSIFDREIVMGNRETQILTHDFKVRPDAIALHPFVFDDKKCSEFMDMFYAFKPDYIRCYPQNLAQIGRYVIEKSMDANIKAAIVGGNILLKKDKKTIEEAFHTNVFQSYMCGEGGLVACECERHGMHIPMERMIVETLNDDLEDSGRRPGNVVLTSLDDEAMPFIRYEVGDMASVSSRRCRCGREHMIIDELQGRAADVIITQSGTTVHLPFFIQAFSKYEDIMNFRVVQEDVDRVVVNVQTRNGLSGTKEAMLLRELGSVLDGIKIEFVSKKDEFEIHNFRKFRHVENRVLHKFSS